MKTRLFLSVIVLGLVGAQHAHAQDEGVTLDPDSPAGKEYVIPLDSARGTGDSSDVAPPPRSDQESSPPSQARLFGQGIKPARSPAESNRNRSDPDPRRPSGTTRPSRPVERQAENQLRQSVAAADPAPVKVGAIIAALALVLAVGAALIARRRRPTDD